MRKKYNNTLGYFLLFPWLFGFMLMFIIPMVISFYFSFTDYNLLKAPNFVGFYNYKNLFLNDDLFITSLIATFKYVLILVPCRLAFALFVALFVNGKYKGSGAYRTIYYIPSIIGGSIAVAIVWKQIFGNGGAIMTILDIVGIEQKDSLLGNPKTAFYVIILLGIWQFGSSMLIFLAALKQVPVSLYESAELDGAKGFGKFFNITLPMISSSIFFNLVLQMVGGFKVFTESYIITEGGPLNTTTFYVYYLYKNAFQYFQMGYASAMAWILVGIIAVFTIIIFKTQKSWVYYES
ncbi:MAG: carbohydrate ABC transporter permease [Lachnospirales bacterium]